MRTTIWSKSFGANFTALSSDLAASLRKLTLAPASPATATYSHFFTEPTPIKGNETRDKRRGRCDGSRNRLDLTDGIHDSIPGGFMHDGRKECRQVGQSATKSTDSADLMARAVEEGDAGIGVDGLPLVS